MTPGFTSWAELGRINGSVLVIINSPPGAVETVGRLFETVDQHVGGDATFVMAPLAWRAWLSTRGSLERVLFSADDHGRELEINYFLESPAAALWVGRKRLTAIVGTEPHSVYNDEVKQPFEHRVCFLIGHGCLLAHTLPNPYVFKFDLAWLLERCGRPLKVQRYERVCGTMIDELHALWIGRGRPARDDEGDFPEVTGIISRATAAAVLDFDEDGMSSPRAQQPEGSVGEIVSHLAAVSHDRMRQYVDRLQVIAAERETLLQERESLLKEREVLLEQHETLLNEWRATQTHAANLYVERVEAVNLRDRIIDDLHRRHEPLYRRVVRWLRAAT